MIDEITGDNIGSVHSQNREEREKSPSIIFIQFNLSLSASIT
jgi:hypothetical protein